MIRASVDGLLLVDKPRGPTSHDVVTRVKRGGALSRVGHSGTLDPAATGLLPLVVGRATRLVRFLPDGPKTYRGRIRVGQTTTTDDEEGDVLVRHAAPLPGPHEVALAARGLVGRLRQVPPAFSARHLDGRRLYELARAGRPVEAPAHEVEVSRFELSPTEDVELYDFVAVVSAGTYIRALARDLGLVLACGATLHSLVRLAIGPLRLEDAHALPAPGPDRSWVEAALVPLEAMPLLPPPVRLPCEADVQRFRCGREVVLEAAADPGGFVRVLGTTGELLGVGETGDPPERLRPRVVLPPP